jgi:EamA domain-containing membrane protein RarD
MIGKYKAVFTIVGALLLILQWRFPKFGLYIQYKGKSWHIKNLNLLLMYIVNFITIFIANIFFDAAIEFMIGYLIAALIMVIIDVFNGGDDYDN